MTIMATSFPRQQNQIKMINGNEMWLGRKKKTKKFQVAKAEEKKPNWIWHTIYTEAGTMTLQVAVCL